MRAGTVSDAALLEHARRQHGDAADRAGDQADQTSRSDRLQDVGDDEEAEHEERHADGDGHGVLLDVAQSWPRLRCDL